MSIPMDREEYLKLERNNTDPDSEILQVVSTSNWDATMDE